MTGRIPFSPVPHLQSRWGKQKADNVFQNEPESALCIVGQLAPPRCTNADTIIHNDGSHVQNDAMLDTVSKGTSSVMWKAFSSHVTHNVQPTVQPQFSTPIPKICEIYLLFCYILLGQQAKAKGTGQARASVAAAYALASLAALSEDDRLGTSKNAAVDSYRSDT
ncbi:hypothetical protein Tco_1281684, partial [Tanacetum coccineum]